MKGRATGSGLSLVARKTVIVSEVRTARTLHDVAGNRRHVSQLPGCGEEQTFRNNRKALAHRRICGDVAHARESTDAETAIGKRAHLPHSGQRVDIEQMRGERGPILHEAKEIRSASDEGCAGV